MKVQFSDDELRTIIDEHPSLSLDEQASDTDSTEERTFELHEDSAETDSEDLLSDHKAWEDAGGEYL